MGATQFGMQGVNASAKLRRVRTDDNGILLTSAQGAGFIVQNNLVATSAGAYSQGDVIGVTTVIPLTPEAAGVGANALYMIDSVAIVDIYNQKADLDLFFFSGDPSTLGVQLDNAAFDWSGSVGAGFCGRVSFTAADWTSVTGEAVACLNNLGLVVAASLVGTVYAVVIAQSTPTYGAHSPTLRVTVAMRRV